MPVPSMLPQISLPAVLTAPVPAARPAAFTRRGAAHAFDFCLVAGLSSYFSTLFSVLLLGARAPAFAEFGRRGPAVFQRVYEYSGAQLFAASFALFAVAFLVGTPMLLGKTFGMGLFGLRLRGEDGRAPSSGQLLYRLLGCLFTYAAFGIPCAAALVRGDGRLFQDRLSGSSVVEEE